MADTRARSIVPVKKAECITSFETSGFESEEISKYMNTTRSIAANTAKTMIMGLFFMISVLLCVMFQIYIELSIFHRNPDLSFGACTGPKRGPVQANTAKNACMGPENGPVRAMGQLLDQF